MKFKIRRHSREQGRNEYSQWRHTSSSPLEARLAVYLCATQWLRDSWPPQVGSPLEALCRATGAMFVNIGPFQKTLHILQHTMKYYPQLGSPICTSSFGMLLKLVKRLFCVD